MSDSSYFECICSFFRGQSENLQNAMQNLQSTNTLSDIGTGDPLQMPQSPMPVINPLYALMAILAMIWGYMYLQSRKKKALTEKPRNNNKDKGGPGDGGSPPPAVS